MAKNAQDKNVTWLLFCDESGHDHKNTPLEVRGGLAFPVGKIGMFSAAFEKLKLDCFGTEFIARNPEVKGSRLLSRKKFCFAEQEEILGQSARIRGINRLLEAQSQKMSPPARGFSALGQAGLLFADELFKLFEQYGCVLFASAIPKGVKAPTADQYTNYLRKDFIFLQERFFYFLEEKDSTGILVFDQTETQQDRKYIRRVYEYYSKTENGRERAERICPVPLFIDSELSPCIQAADVCLYCVNWGFRRREWKFSGEERSEIADRYARYCGKLQYRGVAYNNGKSYPSYGIIFVPDPYQARR